MKNFLQSLAVLATTLFPIHAAVVTVEAEVIDIDNVGGVIDTFTLTATVADSVTPVVNGSFTTWTFDTLSLVGEVNGVETNFTSPQITDSGFQVSRIDDGSDPELVRYDVFVSLPVPSLTDALFAGQDPLNFFSVSSYGASDFDPFLPLLGDAESLVTAGLNTTTAGYSASLEGGSGELIDPFGFGGRIVIANASVQADPVPEPSSIALTLLGVSLLLRRRR